MALLGLVLEGEDGCWNWGGADTGTGNPGEDQDSLCYEALLSHFRSSQGASGFHFREGIFFFYVPSNADDLLPALPSASHLNGSSDPKAPGLNVSESALAERPGGCISFVPLFAGSRYLRL